MAQQNRRDIFDPKEVGIYHCLQRTVRRCWLCGVDAYSEKSYEHRREWIQSLLGLSSEIWYDVVRRYGKIFQRVAGTPESLAREAQERCQGWHQTHGSPLSNSASRDSPPSNSPSHALLSRSSRVPSCRSPLSDLRRISNLLYENIHIAPISISRNWFPQRLTGLTFVGSE